MGFAPGPPPRAPGAARSNPRLLIELYVEGCQVGSAGPAIDAELVQEVSLRHVERRNQENAEAQRESDGERLVLRTKQVRNALPHPVGGTPGEEAPRAPHEDRGGQAEQEYGGGQATREPEADDRAGRLPHRDHDEAYDHRAEQRALPGIPPARPLLEVSAQRAQGRDASDLEQR